MATYNYGLEPGIGRRTGSSKLRFAVIFLLISAATAAVLWYFWPDENGGAAPEKKGSPEVSQPAKSVTPENEKKSPIHEPAPKPVTTGLTPQTPAAAEPAEKQDVPVKTADPRTPDPTDPPLPPKGVITPEDRKGKDLPVIAAEKLNDPRKAELLQQAENALKNGKLADAEKLAEQALLQVQENSEFFRKAWKVLSAVRVKSLFTDSGTRWSLRYRIKPGDNLSSIAARYRTTADLIRKRNNISGSRIFVGRSLWITPGDWRIAVSKSARLLKLYHLDKDKKETLWAVWEIGIGRMGKTPTGDFAISSRIRHPDWYLPDGRIFKYGDPENQLGEYFLKLAPVTAPGKPLAGYGIHGAKDESAVGRSLSNGCVRMRNADVEAVFYLVPSGTRVVISEN